MMIMTVREPIMERVPVNIGIISKAWACARVKPFILPYSYDDE